MKEVRCEKCNKLLYKTDLSFDTLEEVEEAIKQTKALYKPNEECNPKLLSISAQIILERASRVHIKCPRCGTMNTKRSVEDESIKR